MITAYRWTDGRIIRRARYGNRIARHQRCCCNLTMCCGRRFPVGPTPLHYSSQMKWTLTDVEDCPCIEGIEIILEWDNIAGWVGTGPGGGDCALLSARWKLNCGETPDDWSISLEGPTACVMTPQPAHPVPGQGSCDLVFLPFTNLLMTGIGCCDGDMSGSGEISGIIEEVI